MNTRRTALLGGAALLIMLGAAGRMELDAGATTCSYKPWADAHPEICSPATTTVPPTLPPLISSSTVAPSTTTTSDLIACPGWNPPKSVPPGTPCETPPSTVPPSVKPPCHPAPGSQDQYCDAPTTTVVVEPTTVASEPTTSPTSDETPSGPPTSPPRASGVPLNHPVSALPPTGGSTLKEGVLVAVLVFCGVFLVAFTRFRRPSES